MSRCGWKLCFLHLVLVSDSLLGSYPRKCDTLINFWGGGGGGLMSCWDSFTGLTSNLEFGGTGPPTSQGTFPYHMMSKLYISMLDSEFRNENRRYYLKHIPFIYSYYHLWNQTVVSWVASMPFTLKIYNNNKKRWQATLELV